MDQNTGRENAATTGARAQVESPKAQTPGIDFMLANARDLANSLYMAIRDIHEVTSSYPDSGQTRRDARIFASAMLLGVREFISRLEPKPSLAASVPPRAYADVIAERATWVGKGTDKTENWWRWIIQDAAVGRDSNDDRHWFVKVAALAISAIESMDSGLAEMAIEDVVRDAKAEGLNIYQLAVLTGKDVGWVESVLRKGD